MGKLSNIGTVIAKLRKEKGITQEELARNVGVSAQAVSKWENGGVPDTELLPKIADYFAVSIDTLFDRDFDNRDISAIIAERIRKHDIRSPMRFREAFELCWTLERSLFTFNDEKLRDKINFQENTIADYEARLKDDGQTHSCIESDYGFTRMGVANRVQYFLMVQEIKDKEKALFEGIDYTAFFSVISDQDVFRTLVLLYKRDERKDFTEKLIMKELSVGIERANEIISALKRINLVITRKLELDDEIKDVYTFVPNTAFVALLIFAREMIERPRVFAYQSGFRTKPYLA